MPRKSSRGISVSDALKSSTSILHFFSKKPDPEAIEKIADEATIIEEIVKSKETPLFQDHNSPECSIAESEFYQDPELLSQRDISAPSCPICSYPFSRLSDSEALIHVNQCLDHLEPVKSQSPEFLPPINIPSAFTKIMLNRFEDKQWQFTTERSRADRSKRSYLRSCPFYKIMPHMRIAVDAFKFGKIPDIDGYFLSHFHSDHYGGLSSSWTHGKIYCSDITANLVLQQLRVAEAFVVRLPMDKTIWIEQIGVTCIGANHCPGSVLFLFEKQVQGRWVRYLHCGDFRANPLQVLHPAIKGKWFDTIYLDTTYLSSKHAFPAQDDVISATSQICLSLSKEIVDDDDPVEIARREAGIGKFVSQKTASRNGRGRLLVIVGTYSIGKERIVMGIARAMRSKIFAPLYKRRICACLEDPELLNLITDNPIEASVHITTLREIRAETSLEYLEQFKPHFSRIVAFRPTGWTFTSSKRRAENPSVETIIEKWKTPYGIGDLKPQRGSSATVTVYGVPYSEHSSFRELTCFCCSLEWGRIVPTVNVHSARSRDSMKAWCNLWKKHQGYHVYDGQRQW
ncbi:DNA cross-link repair protein pso2/snm1 [Neolecta irregularis DAH-3]|uniref:DNA cross-link repair protein pso2/snm1 n=1 Tax=Neolecta irregularis (strain DAH-3) TaxID=1198029 RepID=A0A1U7LPL9_NEOID|nr:DNA cross-link repair protein pso2/snm1 [Neolecta irregularis DAH-3]|eukprot:OLL24533.1 DNA cross-link repair protein pso2/snm1 [Neolecta irregularis DAH-3]